MTVKTIRDVYNRLTTRERNKINNGFYPFYLKNHSNPIKDMKEVDIEVEMFFKYYDETSLIIDVEYQDLLKSYLMMTCSPNVWREKKPEWFI